MLLFFFLVFFLFCFCFCFCWSSVQESHSLSTQAHEREQEKNKCEKGTKPKTFVLGNKKKIIKSLLHVYWTLCLECNVSNWKSARSHDTEEKVRRTKLACSEGTAAAGTLRVRDFLRMGQKQGKCWEGVIGRSESRLE